MDDAGLLSIVYSLNRGGNERGVLYDCVAGDIQGVAHCLGDTTRGCIGYRVKGTCGVQVNIVQLDVALNSQGVVASLNRNILVT